MNASKLSLETRERLGHRSTMSTQIAISLECGFRHSSALKEILAPLETDRFADERPRRVADMTAMEVQKAYSKLPEREQILVASFITADLMTMDSEFAERLSRRHQQMDAGYKHTHESCWNFTTKWKKEGR